MGKDLTIHFFHGFLGLPSDWTAWQKLVATHGWKSEISCLWDFVQQSEASLATFCAEYVERNLKSPAVLFGYSMGGRLALEIAKRYPEKVHALILASTQLVSAQAESDRLRWEAEWSKRFLEASWSALCRDWEAQDVFAATKVLPRNEADFDRYALARAMHAWSITKQDWNEGNFPKVPTLWMIGADDLRMQLSMQHLQKICASAELFPQPQAGHRFIFELPEQTVQKTLEFLSLL